MWFSEVKVMEDEEFIDKLEVVIKEKIKKMSDEEKEDFHDLFWS